MKTREDCERFLLDEGFSFNETANEWRRPFGSLGSYTWATIENVSGNVWRAVLRTKFNH